MKQQETMEISRYGHEKKDDFPYVLTGFFLSLTLLLEIWLTDTYSLLKWFLLLLILLDRWVVRKVWIGVSQSYWTVKTTFLPPVVIPVEKLLKVSIIRMLPTFRLGITYRNKSGKINKSFIPLYFDNTGFLEKIREEYPDLFERDMNTFLERYRRDQSRNRFYTFSLIMLSAVILMAILTWVSSHDIIPGKFGYYLFFSVQGVSWLLVLMSWFGFKRYRWSNKKASHGFLALSLVFFLIYLPFSTTILNASFPADITTGLITLSVLLLVTAIVVLIRINVASSLAVFVLMLIPLLLNIPKSTPGPIQLEKIHGGRDKQFLLDYGWLGDANAFYYQTAGKGSLEHIVSDLESDQETNLKTEFSSSAGQSGKESGVEAFVPVNRSTWLELTPERILIRRIETPSADILYRAGKGEADSSGYKRPVLRSPSGRWIVFLAHDRKIHFWDSREDKIHTIPIEDTTVNLSHWISDSLLTCRLSGMGDVLSQVYRVSATGIQKASIPIIIADDAGDEVEVNCRVCDLFKRNGLLIQYKKYRENRAIIEISRNGSPGKSYQIPGVLLDGDFRQDSGLLLVTNEGFLDWWYLEISGGELKMEKISRNSGHLHPMRSHSFERKTVFQENGNHFIWPYRSQFPFQGKRGFAVWKWCDR